MDHAEAFGQLLAGTVVVAGAIELGFAFLFRVGQEGVPDL